MQWLISLVKTYMENGKWTKEKKRKILDSRLQTTKLLCKTLASINRPPKVLVAASATGYYGGLH